MRVEVGVLVVVGCTSAGGCARGDGCTRGRPGEFLVVSIRVAVSVLVVVGVFGDMRLRFWVKETRCTQLWSRLGVTAGDVFAYRCKAPRKRCTQSERSASVATNNGPWISTSIAFARTSVDQRTSRRSFTIIIVQYDVEICSSGNGHTLQE